MHRHAFPVHGAVKAFIAVFAFQLKGRMGNLEFVQEDPIDFLDDFRGLAHHEVVDQKMGAKGIDPRADGP